MDTRKWWLIIWEYGHPLTDTLTLNKDWCTQENASEWAENVLERGKTRRVEVWDDNPKAPDAMKVAEHGENI